MPKRRGQKPTARRPKFTPVRPKSRNQRAYLEAIEDNTVVMCRGHAGTGKTLLALSAALKLFYNREAPQDQIIIVRPYIKSNMGEDIGALPGKLEQKVGPFVESIIDNLRQLCTREEATRLIRDRNIDFTILSMCRGRSFNNCVVIVEEAQNVPLNGNGMKMLLTRVGNNCKMIICGDTDQIDLPGGKDHSALDDTFDAINGVEDVECIELNKREDIQRSAVVRRIIEAFDKKIVRQTGISLLCGHEKSRLHGPSNGTSNNHSTNRSAGLD